jgi:hypothetical protein
MAFVRLQPTPEPAAVGGNAELFYLSSFPAVTPEESPRLDALVNRAKGSLDLLHAFRREGFRWFVETREGVPKGRSSWLLSFLADECPRCVAFTGKQGRVLDLRALEAAERAGRLPEPALPEGRGFVPSQR